MTILECLFSWMTANLHLIQLCGFCAIMQGNINGEIAFIIYHYILNIVHCFGVVRKYLLLNFVSNYRLLSFFSINNINQLLKRCLVDYMQTNMQTNYKFPITWIVFTGVKHVQRRMHSESIEELLNKRRHRYLHTPHLSPISLDNKN